MSKIKKSELLDIVREQGSAITNLLQRVTLLEKPQLKQLDQSVFDGLDEKWRWFGVNSDGSTIRATNKPKINVSNNRFILLIGDSEFSDDNYDASNWQSSLIEREVAKELTGSDLTRAMLARGDTRIMCKVYDIDRQDDTTHVIRACNEGGFHTKANHWTYAIPINNQGEPLTAAEAGL